MLRWFLLASSRAAGARLAGSSALKWQEDEQEELQGAGCAAAAAAAACRRCGGGGGSHQSAAGLLPPPAAPAAAAADGSILVMASHASPQILTGSPQARSGGRPEARRGPCGAADRSPGEVGPHDTTTASWSPLRGKRRFALSTPTARRTSRQNLLLASVMHEGAGGAAASGARGDETGSARVPVNSLTGAVGAGTSEGSRDPQNMHMSPPRAFSVRKLVPRARWTLRSLCLPAPAKKSM